MRPEVQLLLLLMALPTQYLISRLMTPETTDREYLTRKFFIQSINTFKKICSISEWKSYIVETFLLTTDRDECVANEVMLYQEPNGYFSGSPEPRTDRSGVKYRVGQVIKHKKFGYRGVIVGWDKRTKAPDYWIQVNHFDPNWRYQPNYSVLVDVRDREDVQTTYVVEENMEIIPQTEINHPDAEDYFEKHDGSYYAPKPWLKKLYPHD